MTNQSASFLERLSSNSSLGDQDSSAGYSVSTTDDTQNEIVDPRRALENEFQRAEHDQNDAEWHSVVEDPEEGQLTLDVFQTDDAIVLLSTIAGVQSEDLDVSIASDMVTIRGIRRRPNDIPEEKYFYQECYWGPFSRSVILPVEVEAEAAQASIKNGILTVVLPKVKKDIARKIRVIEG